MSQTEEQSEAADLAAIEKTEPHEEIEISRTEKIAHLAVVILPFVGLVMAVALLWGNAFHWYHGLMLFVGYVLTGLGITVGFHRLFTHRSFETPGWMKFVWGVLGSAAVEGPLLTWVARHRKHHQHSDDHDDPHSPHHHGTGLVNMMRGLWHAHAGWLLTKNADLTGLNRYIVDLRTSKVVRVVHYGFPAWVLLSLIIPTVIGGLITMSWMGALLGFLWGGAVRIFVVHHITWSINSVCHIWGRRDFKSHDESRNNLIFGVLGLGEGWHNNHHAFPTSARHGLKWWQIDVSYMLIKLMQAVGLAWSVRTPAPEIIERKRMPRA